nr:MAG TPA: hypothetical protein [Caudoviricetes sp.]
MQKHMLKINISLFFIKIRNPITAITCAVIGFLDYRNIKF